MICPRDNVYTRSNVSEFRQTDRKNCYDGRFPENILKCSVNVKQTKHCQQWSEKRETRTGANPTKIAKRPYTPPPRAFPAAFYDAHNNYSGFFKNVRHAVRSFGEQKKTHWRDTPDETGFVHERKSKYV